MVERSNAIDPHSAHSISLKELGISVWKNRQLIFQMTKREITGRYKGSVLGLAWSFFNPIFMLTVYTFVFSVIFKSRWNGESSGENKVQFALILFSGLIILNLFSEILNRAPGLILANVNYVKKVIFPLEILTLVSAAASLFHFFISLSVLLFAFGVFNGFLNWTIVLVPIVILPLIILILGFAWILASLGVFLRDVGQTVVLLTTVLMFLSPVFYPVSAVPEKLRPILMLSPPSFIIEQMREIIIWGRLPNWTGLLVYMVIAVVVAWTGFALFQKTRKGFADVL